MDTIYATAGAITTILITTETIITTTTTSVINTITNDTGAGVSEFQIR